MYPAPGGGYRVPAIEGTMSEVEATFEEVRRRIGEPGFVLIDVLPRESFRGGHIPGAISLPLDEIPARAAEVLPDRTADIVAYCGKPT
jgi:rhodanese-related sulfurtransferase